MTAKRTDWDNMTQMEKRAYLARARTVKVVRHHRLCRVRRVLVDYYVAVIRGVEIYTQHPGHPGWRTPDRAQRDGERLLRKFRSTAREGGMRDCLTCAHAPRVWTANRAGVERGRCAYPATREDLERLGLPAGAQLNPPMIRRDRPLRRCRAWRKSGND